MHPLRKQSRAVISKVTFTPLFKFSCSPGADRLQRMNVIARQIAGRCGLTYNFSD